MRGAARKGGPYRDPRINWARMNRLATKWLPPARVTHPFPDVRFRVRTQGRSPVR